MPSDVSLCRDIQNPVRHSPGQPGLADSTWAGGDGLHNLRRSLPTCTTFWFFETNLWNKHLLPGNFSLFCSKHCAGFEANTKTIKKKCGRLKSFTEFLYQFFKSSFLAAYDDIFISKIFGNRKNVLISPIPISIYAPDYQIHLCFNASLIYGFSWWVCLICKLTFHYTFNETVNYNFLRLFHCFTWR